MSADGPRRGADPAQPRAPAPVDARLVPAALAAWLGAFVAVARTPPEVLVLAAVTGAGALLAAVALARARRAGRRREASATTGAATTQPHSRGHPRTTRRPGARHRGAPTSPPAAAALLTVVVLLAVLLTTAAHLHARHSGLLADLTTRGASAVLTGRVGTEPRAVAQPQGRGSAPRYRLMLRVEEVAGRGETSGAAATVVLVGPLAWAEVPLGAQVRVRAGLVATAPGDGPAALAFTDRTPEVQAGPGWPLAAVNHLRGSLRAVTADLPAQARGLVPGIAVGDDRALPPELAADMRATSLTHLTAVSGAHIAILLGAVLGALVWLPRAWRVGLGAVALVAFVTLVRPEASVLRSAVMGAVVLAALLLGRPARALPGLCAAVTLLLVADPWLARSYGFVLSVLATGGLVLLARPWARWLSHLVPRCVATALAVPAAAQAVCAPVVVLLTPALSTYAVPANLLAAPAVPPVTVLGVAATLLAPVWPAGAHALAVTAGWCTWWIAAVAGTFAALPGAQLPWPPGAGGALALALATVVAVRVLARLRPGPAGWRRAAPVVVVVATLAVVPWPRVTGWLPGGWPPAGWVVIQCDVGQGGAVLVRSGERAAVMVDVGPVDGRAEACLSAAGVERLDLLVLTHGHADHVGGLTAVLATVDVSAALLTPGDGPGSSTARVLEQLRDIPVTRPVADGGGTRGRAGAVDWEVLWPPAAAVARLRGDDGVNDLSLVLRLSVPGVAVVALGDVELAGQAGLVRRLRGAPAAADVVVMAHHGSALQDDALAGMLRPRLAVVSVGSGNEYGHPAPDAVTLYGRLGAVVQRTDTCGPIAVVRDGDGLATVSGCPP
ncbi:ComEC/Rec2 family competence protein [Georgenia sp. SYP-B2076]|uniref:ComEC/Rec2 family competence protein n=1 Tax=Georgenia sp. SYP-B2076 TaxID=2495881 RepID=UPI000F8D3C28|nr:ComEC/Rec2 family competence protein [Georgenia sp. SYP-B2076]